MKKHLKLHIIWIALIVLVALLIDFLIAQGIITQVYERTLVTIFINIILAVGLNLVIGIAGQFSLGHAGFMAIGAYAGAILMMQVDGILGLLLGMLVGAILAGGVAVIIGIPTLRLTGDYLAIATLGASEIIRIIILTSDNITNGAIGISGIPDTATWSIVYVFVIITTVLVLNYIRSSAGRATLAIRENEIAAEAMGVHSLKYKVTAFVIGAMTASVAGTLYASYLGVVAPKDFTFQKSIDVLIIVVFGGIGSVTGSIIAAISLGILNTLLQPVGEWRTIIYAIALILVMIFRPSGLLGRRELMISPFLNRQKGASQK
ncbi:branched-chain amino acid ABC transporter permease [Granulicatella sp. zg-ZJ]|uniref:branched-chain amino acid ABC transporter permease n=1 Tax=unclassified Granulicatella TaxID=2630493 RepID=UPI0013C0CE86|nr:MULTISPECIES: branched-chain amino acid ABC transporter permease [unclassified Granulicatella]MBS4749912.1 branched-chain amino acid ABC transporter permease [Carnobacteriaceae bacterium zg-ZUI78]NEW62090.1 branched-chain amino acid ABC transporter permease [Granulicatella sp. zg-ZJ]NEW66403.1 branched-chain amino acid ABC transporter permease [Granulicatella sp. zg-84]QMI86131.1 branched-chain amino acid ABC transporter permease [Carnobacteriaceae bacterium zg-84]